MTDNFEKAALVLRILMDISIIYAVLRAAVTDGREHIIPDKVNFYIFSSGVCYLSLTGSFLLFTGTDITWEGDFKYAVITRIAGVVLLPAIMLSVNIIMKGAFGGGDVKMAGALAMVYGFESAGGGILFGILLSGFYGIILLVTKIKKMSDRFPLGPFLAAGMAVEILKFWSNWPDSILQADQTVGIL